ncbi:uncharacterized protein CDAR_99971 [Caerostris darwini]|uniref:Uncharacterized protein n=1 Tax=Caerostris darwini TaxID=1538125 RepID=A0AAV4REK2_9ARAC|nr:uncharacterized protein CDAR_99971 [Caerostris darwini]
MVSLYVFCLVVFIEVVAGVSVNETQTSGNKTDVKTRSGRWLGDNEPQYSVQLGYYASPDYTDESDDRDDKGKYSLPTSFADFKPDDKQSRYPPPPPLPNAWKTDSLPAPWMFPSDVASIVNAMADVHDEKPTGLLAKLKAEPLTILLAAAIPLSILLAAVLPSLINLIMNGNMNTPPATTIASGNRSDTGRNYKNNEPSIVVKVLEAIENMSAFNDLMTSASRRLFAKWRRELMEQNTDPFNRTLWRCFLLCLMPGWITWD